MINVLLTVEGSRNMPKHLNFPQRLNEVRLKENLTERVGKYKIDYVSSGIS